MKTIQPSTTAPRRSRAARILAGSIAALVTVGSLATPRAQAASQIWDGGSGANGNWSTLLNWVGDTAAPGATSGTTNIDIATFNAAIANTWGLVGTPIIIDSATQNIGGINFDTAAGNYFIGTTGGNSLLLSSGGTIQILSTLTATNAIETINAPLVIQGAGGTYTFANNSANGSGAGAGTLNFGGGITGGAGGTTTLTLSGSNTNANTIGGIIGNGSATMAITKAGAGTWVLSGANTYTGAAAINAGVLNIQHATALGFAAGTTTTVASGAALQIQGGITVGAEALSLNGTGVLATGALRNISGANVWQGTVTLAGTTRINSDSGSLTFNTAANSITGSNRNLTLGGVGNGTVGGTITTGTGTLTKDGAGTWTLSGANTYTGQTSVNLGVLLLDNATALPGGIGSAGGTSNLNINGTTDNSSVFYGGIIGLGNGNFTRALGTGVTQVQFSQAGGWAAFGADRIVNLGGAGGTVTWANTSATGGFNGKNLYLGTATATHTVDLQNAIDMTNGARTVVVDNGAAAIDAKMSGIITGVAGGNLTKSGSGTLVLSGANIYLGTTTISAGVLRVTGNSSVANGAVTVSSGAALGGNGTLGGAVTVNTGGAIDLRDTATGTLTINNTLTFNGTTAAPNNLYFDLPNGAGATDKIVTTGAVTAAGGASGVLVNFNQLAGTVTPGTGVILIQPTAASTYANYALATTRSGGNVYSNLTASGNNLVVDIATAAAGAGAAFWAGGATSWSTVANWNTDATSSVALGSIPGVGTNVTFATTTPVATNLTDNTVDVDFEINSLTFNAAAGGVTIGGTSMLTIDATNANGNTLGNGITSSNTSGTNTISTKIGLGGNQTWTTSSGGTLAVTGVVSDFGGGYSLTKAGAGTLTLSAVNTITGPITISAGELQIGGAGNLNAVSYAGNITNNGTLRYSSSLGDTFSGVISGTGALIKDTSSASTLTLSGVNTYSGGTTINSGGITMGLLDSAAFGSGPITVNTGGQLNLNRSSLTNSLILNGGTITSSNGFGDAWNGPVTLLGTPVFSPSGNTLTVAGNISGSGAPTKNGSGTLALSGTNNYTGTTTLTAGIILVNAAEIAGASGPLGTPATPAGSIVLGGGTLQYSAANIFDYSSRFSTAASQIYNADTNNQSVIWGANLTSSGGTLTKSGVGFLFLTGANTYDGATTIGNGTLGVSSLNFITTGTLSPATSSSLGKPTSAANGTIAIGSGGNTGRLFYTGPGETTDRVISLAGTAGGGATIEQGGTGLLKFNSALTATGTGTKTLTLQGSTAGTGELAAAIVDGSGTTALTKAGSGLWTLSGANTYTGATTVGGGTLTFNRQTGSLNSASALTFGGGGGTFNMDNVGASGALTQTLGALTFSVGGGRVMTTRTAAFDQAITFASLAARTAGATGNFVNTGMNSATNGFVFTAAPAAGALIDRGYFYNGSSYAAYDAGGFIRAFGAADTGYLAAPTAATIGASTSASNVDLTTGNITAQTTISANTINLRANSLTMSAAGQILSTNGILSSGSSTATLGIGTKDSILQAAAAGNELVIRVDGSSDKLTLNSTIQNNTSAGKLTKTGAGALTLTGTNTFTGGAYLNSGTLNINSIGALNSLTANGNTGGAGVQGSLLVNDGTTISNTSGGALTFVSGGFGDHNPDATNRLVSLILNGSVTFDGLADHTKDLFLSRMGDNNSATVQLLQNSTVNVTAGTFNIGSKVLGTGGAQTPFSLTKNGPGELQVGNFNNKLDFTGGLFVNEGTFTGSSPQAAFGNGVSNGPGMVFLGDLTPGNTKNATLSYFTNNGSNNNTPTANSLTVNAGSSGTLAFVTDNSGGTLTGLTGATTLNNNLTLAAKVASTTNQLSGTVSGIGGLRIGGTTNTNLGTVLLSGSNTYTGGTIVNTGTLTGTGTSPFGATTGTLAVNNTNTGAGTAAVLNLPTTAATTTGSLSGTIATPSSGTNTATINNNGGQLLTVNQTSAGTYAGVIAGNGSFTLGASSTNTLTLSGANTYTGATTITAGTLSVATIGNGGVASGNLGSATSAAANLVFNGGTLQYTGATASTDRNFAINTGKTATFDITSNNLTVSGASTTTNGALTKTGNGTLTLSGANTYTGATTVSVGTMTLASTASLANTAMTVLSGATLSVQAGGGNVISTGTLSLNSGSLFTMSGDSGIGTFTLQGAGTGLTLGGATVPSLTFDIGNAATGTDRIIVTNNVSAPSGGIITINQLAGLTSLTVGNYNLITSAGGFTGGGANGFTLSASTISVGSTLYDLSLANSTSSNQVLTVSLSAAPVAFWAGSTNGTWNTAGGANWRTSVAGNVGTGVSPSATTNVFFVTTTPAAANLTTTLGADTTISSLNFTADATSPVSIGGNTLTINAGAGSGITVASGSAAHTISSNVALGGSQTWTVANAAANALTVSGAVTGGFDLNKAGTGTLILRGANTYTGVTTVSAGMLQFGTTAALYNSTTASWTAAKIKVASGSTLALNVGGSGEFSAVNVTTVLSNLGGANGTSTTGFAAGSNIAFDTTNASPTTFTVADNIANSTGSGGGAIGVTKLGTNTLVLTGTNTYTGATTISAGTLQLGSGGTTGSLSTSTAITNNGNLTINRSNAVVQGTNFSTAAITGTGSHTQAGAGTTTLNAANYTGVTTVSAGTLQFTKTAALYNSNVGSWTAGNINVASGGTMALNVGGTGEFSTGDVTTLLTNLAASASATDGMNAGAILGFDTTGASGGSFTVADVIADTTDASGGLRGITKLGSGNLTLTGANTYTGGTVVNSGTFTLGNQNGGGTGSFTLAAGTTFQQETFEGNEVGGALPNAFVLSGTGNVTMNIPFSQKDIWLSQVVSGTGGMTVQGGSRKLTLTGDNIFSGGVRLTNANHTVQISHNNALGSGTFRSESAFNNAYLIPLTDLTTGSGVPNAFDIASGAYLNVNTSGDGGTVNLLLSGPISSAVGAGSLYKTGAGTLILSGANTYTGTTTVNAGSLQLGNGSTTGTLSTSSAITTNAEFTINRSNAVAQGTDFSTAAITGTGSLTQAGAGTTTLNTANTYTGGTTVNNGTLVLNGANTGTGVIRGVVTVNSGATLQLASANALGYNTGVRVKTVNINGGLLEDVVNGDQGFNQTYNLTGGTMRANGGVSSPTSSQWFAFGSGFGGTTAVNTFASGTISAIEGRIIFRNDNLNTNVDFTVADGGGAMDLLVSAAITQNAGLAIGLTKAGAGLMRLTGTNSYAGVTVINEGTLSISTSANLGNASATNTIAINGGTLQDTGAGVNLGVNRSVAIGASGGTVDVAAASDLTISGAVSGAGNTLTKTGNGTLKFAVGSTQSYAALVALQGTTNVNSAVGSGTSSVSVTGSGTSLKFGSVNQTLSSLNIGAGSTVTFVSGLASFSGEGDGGKEPSFGAAPVVPEPGTMGLLLVGALGLATRRRRHR